MASPARDAAATRASSLPDPCPGFPCKSLSTSALAAGRRSSAVACAPVLRSASRRLRATSARRDWVATSRGSRHRTAERPAGGHALAACCCADAGRASEAAEIARRSCSDRSSTGAAASPLGAAAAAAGAGREPLPAESGSVASCSALRGRLLRRCCGRMVSSSTEPSIASNTAATNESAPPATEKPSASSLALKLLPMSPAAPSAESSAL
mmetsp:Transcript_23051/g.87157  ORF Transcript_23051/g.87157 Transcript_23051/m.87157 type:complete len:211 (+) Transcript_23051:491-1123(+)